jgi:lipopolysaccharide biosynthesis protein
MTNLPSTPLRQLRYRVLRALFRLTPMPVAWRDRLRTRFLERRAHWLPPAPRSELVAAAGERRARVQAGGRAIGHRPFSRAPLPSPLPATLIAFYLPQFHPIPENDAWWGEGFTEWRNVTRALPQFEGHAQPRLPGELGFYDLRLPEVMRRQIALARAYGVGAFCAYFYWFGGKTLLEQPLRQWLTDPTLDFPLCLCWANESWSRRWDGRGDEILIGQRHDAQDDLAFITHVAEYLRDPRYLRLDGKPLLLVYRPGLLPDAKATAARWRRWCREQGIGEIELAYVQSFDHVDPRDIGFDAAVAFPPNGLTPTPITPRQRLIDPDFHGEVFDWRELAQSRPAPPPYPHYLCVNPGWDNEPRRSGRGRIYLHASPRGFRDWLRAAIAEARRREPHRTAPPVFINAWNEWAEGAVLEPDLRLGHAWLAATRAALQAPLPADPRPCVIVHAWYADAFAEILDALQASGLNPRLIVTTTQDRAQAMREALAARGLEAAFELGENRGRDILPFLRVADRLLDEGVEVVLKLHTKRSTHRADGDRWRHELIERLLAPRRAGRLAQAFAADPKLGLIAAEGHVQPLHYYWGANRDTVDYLARRLGIDAPDPASDRFIAGSMFWARLAALRPLLDAHLDEWEFEPEAGQVDGTFAHAIERVFLLAARHAGFVTREAADLCGEPRPAAAPYPYAAADRPPQ